MLCVVTGQPCSGFGQLWCTCEHRWHTCSCVSTCTCRTQVRAHTRIPPQAHRHQGPRRMSNRGAALRAYSYNYNLPHTQAARRHAHPACIGRCMYAAQPLRQPTTTISQRRQKWRAGLPCLPLTLSRLQSMMQTPTRTAGLTGNTEATHPIHPAPSRCTPSRRRRRCTP